MTLCTSATRSAIKGPEYLLGIPSTASARSRVLRRQTWVMRIPPASWQALMMTGTLLNPAFFSVSIIRIAVLAALRQIGKAGNGNLERGDVAFAAESDFTEGMNGRYIKI